MCISGKVLSANILSTKGGQFMSPRLLLPALTFVFVLGAPVPSMAAAVKWKELDGQIELNSVCYNHKYGSIVYRQCRADAQKQLKGRCTHFRRQLESATGSQRADVKKSEHKYCYAARHLRIVN